MDSTVKWSALLLEDEALIAFEVEQALKDVGVRVLAVVASCADALQWLEANSPDVAVVDMELQDGNCASVVKLLSERDIPFVVHSGSTFSSDYHDPIFLKGSWVNKPSDPSELVNAVIACVSYRSTA